MEYEFYIGKLKIRQSVKLLLLTPISPKDGNEGPFPLIPRREHLLPSTNVDEMYCKGAPRVASKEVAPMVVAKSRWAESQGYDAVVVNCMLDPGVSQAKRAVQIPVVGIREASLAVASLVGRHPDTIYPHKIPVLELAADEENTVHELVKKGQGLISRRGTDVIIPGCGYLGELSQRLQAELSVPVLANIDVGLRVAESLAVLGVFSPQKGVKAKGIARVSRIVSRVAFLIKWVLS